MRPSYFSCAGGLRTRTRNTPAVLPAEEPLHVVEREDDEQHDQQHGAEGDHTFEHLGVEAPAAQAFDGGHIALNVVERQDRQQVHEPEVEAQEGKQAVQQSWYPILLAFLSFNLGLMNLLPILPFDGGHIALNVVERLRGRRLNAKVLERMIAFGTVLLVMLFIVLTFNDVKRLFGG